MTHKCIHTLLGFMLFIVLASPTMAGTQQPASTNTLTQEDIEFAFGPGSNIADFTQLSPQEMAETDGDFWYFWPNMWRSRFRFIVDFGRSLIRGEWFRLGHYAYKFGYHRELHNFGPKWGPLQGGRPHLQVDRMAIRIDPKTGRPLGKRYINGEYRYPGIRTPKGRTPGDKKPYKPLLRIPWGRRGNLGKRPGRPEASSLGAEAYANVDDFTPSDALISLIASEIQIREEWLRGPQPMSETADPYEGPLPSQTLRGHIFRLVAPTKADACRDYGGRVFGC